MTPSPRRISHGLIVLLLFCAFSFSAIVTIASADHYHTNCVDHGFVHGESTTDGSFFSRVYEGCGSTQRTCKIYSGGAWQGTQTVNSGTGTCNLWSQSLGSFTECASYAKVYSSGVFSEHDHLAHNWCG